MMRDQEKPDSIAWDKIGGPLAAAEDALARLDERLRTSPIAEGWISRTHFQDACASLWLAGELVMLEDLVLHDARMDVRSPTHEVTRAQAVLRARRRIAAAEPAWPMSRDGLAALRGDGDGGPAGVGRSGEAVGEEYRQVEAPEAASDDPLANELAALDRALNRSSQVLAGVPAASKVARDPHIYDPDWEDGEKFEAWRRAAPSSLSNPPLLAAAVLWDAWETNPPLERQAWLGNLLVPAVLRQWGKTRSHLLCLNSALRHSRRERRRSPDRATRLIDFLELNCGWGCRRCEGSRPLAARPTELGTQARKQESRLPFARLGGFHPGPAGRLGRHDRGRTRRDAACGARHGR